MDVDPELLCSPRKIRKLARSSQALSSTSKPDANQKFSQGSQESRATSTPTKRSLPKRLSISSEISSITLQTSSVKSSSSNEVEDDVSIALSLLEELSINGSCSDLLRRPNSKIFRGKAWNFLKPKFQETLYFKVFKNIDNIENTAYEYLEQLRSDENKGILTVIKFFVDLCGYQPAQIDEYFNFDQDFSISCEKVIKLMEFDLVDDAMLEAKTYIFYESERRKSKIGLILASSTKTFLEKILIAAYHQNILFSRSFHKRIFNFLFYMCQSILRPIRHTGISLVRIILTVLNYIYSRIVKKLEMGSSQSDHDRLPIEKEIEYSEKYMQHFFGIFAKNSFIPDPNLLMLRVIHVHEMGNWMVELPQIYFKNCANHLYKFTLDESELVRLSALQVWKHLLKTTSVRSHFVKHLDDIVLKVQSRLKDIRLRVVVKAIDFFSVLVEYYPDAIGEDIVCAIIELLYANNYLYAKAAGFFIMNSFNSSKLTEKQILQKFIDISSQLRFQDMKHFFVEAFAEHQTVLQNYKLMIEVLLSCAKETELQRINSLFDLMYHSIHQKLKGEPVEERMYSFSAVPSNANHEEIAKLLLLNLKNLFDLFEDQLSLLNNLMKILVLIDYDVLSSHYRPHLIYLIKNSRHLLLHSNDEEFLGNISKLFHYLCFEKNTYLKNDLTKSLVNLFENLSIYMQGYLDEPETQEMALDLHFMKIGKLYEKFNINNYFQWNSIFTVWGTIPICKGQIISCNYHILWTIKDLMKEWTKANPDEHRLKKINLESRFPEYTESLVNLMISPDAADILKLDAFEYFCLLHITSYQILLKDEELLSNFKVHILQSLKTHVPGTLVKFFSNNIVHHKSTTYEKRKQLICYWLELILNALTDVLYIVPLFECYHTRSEEYGSLIELIAETIFEKNQEVFFQLILATLSKLAKQVFQTSLKTLSSPEARQLIALGIKFANMKEFSNASKEVLRMIHLGIKACFKSELFELLILLQNFLPKLSEEHYSDCLQIFSAMTPKEFENHEYIRTFRAKLVVGKSKATGKKISVKEVNVSSAGNFAESDNSVTKTPKRPKKGEGNNRKSKARKSLPFDEFSKENIEKGRSKKKNKAPELGRH